MDDRLPDIEAFEEISRDEVTRALFLRIAALQRSGGVPTFLAALDRDPDLAEDVKRPLAEIARDAEFLSALEDYCRKTDRLH